MLQADWGRDLQEHHQRSDSTVVGLICGARENNDRRVVDSLASSLCSKVLGQSAQDSFLVVRLNVQQRFLAGRITEARQPPVAASPLGPWSEVSIDVPVSRTASAELLALPGWVSTWKKQFELIMMDLGPINLVPSRVLGRLCDFNHVVLGPVSCGSSEWILEHVAWHARAGTEILGNICVQMTPEDTMLGRRVSA